MEMYIVEIDNAQTPVAIMDGPLHMVDGVAALEKILDRQVPMTEILPPLSKDWFMNFPTRNIAVYRVWDGLYQVSIGGWKSGDVTEMVVRKVFKISDEMLPELKYQISVWGRVLCHKNPQIIVQRPNHSGPVVDIITRAV